MVMVTKMRMVMEMMVVVVMEMTTMVGRCALNEKKEENKGGSRWIR